jgi:hypothetical protein
MLFSRLRLGDKNFGVEEILEELEGGGGMASTLRFPDFNFARISYIPYACYMPFIPHSP